MNRHVARPRAYVQRARAASAEATARRIVDAFLARLMTQWFDEITLERVAADAGVTVQTLVRRFGGKPGVLEEATRELAVRINARRATPPGNLEQMVKNLVADYEQTGDAIIRLLALEPRHAVLAETLAFGRAEHRRWVADVLATALDRLDATGRKRALDALVVVTDVYTWKLLRRDLARTVSAATATMTALARGAISACIDDPDFRKEH